MVELVRQLEKESIDICLVQETRFKFKPIEIQLLGKYKIFRCDEGVGTAARQAAVYQVEQA